MTETVTAENDDNSDGWTTQEDPSSREMGEKTKWVDEEEDEGVEHSSTCMYNPIGWQ